MNPKNQQHILLILASIVLGSLSACGGGGGSSPAINSDIPIIVSSSSSTSSNSSVQSSSSSSIVQVTQCLIENFKDQDTISYRLPILYGRCPSADASLTLTAAGKTYTWPVKDGYFKGAVLLNTGENEISLNPGGKTSNIKINVAVSQNAKKVQMVYAIAANDDGHFIAAPGEANDIESAKKRLVVEALMMQSATARMMYKATGKHQTFTLVEDETGMPLIETFQMAQTRTSLYEKDGMAIYYLIQEQLKTEMQNANKYIVTMGFSGYENGKLLAHTALGGSNLAIFGGAALHTCPQTLDEISANFSNNTFIDTKLLPDDSAGRGTYWANCSTGMGASLHELGHTFGLPHTSYGIMNRGFDHFNRLFMLTEPDFTDAITTDREFDAVWHPDRHFELLVKGADARGEQLPGDESQGRVLGTRLVRGQVVVLEHAFVDLLRAEGALEEVPDAHPAREQIEDALAPEREGEESVEARDLAALTRLLGEHPDSPAEAGRRYEGQGSRRPRSLCGGQGQELGRQRYG